ncbi:MAG: hypothetical protein AAB573_02655 [Patescibacteria group bacterium]
MADTRRWRTVGEWAREISLASIEAGVIPWKRTTLGYKPSVVEQIAQMSVETEPHESRKRAHSTVREYAPSVQLRRALRVVRMLGQKLPIDTREAWAENALKRLEDVQ